MTISIAPFSVQNGKLLKELVSCDVVINFLLFFILYMIKLLMQKKAKKNEEIMSGESSWKYRNEMNPFCLRQHMILKIKSRAGQTKHG